MVRWRYEIQTKIPRDFDPEIEGSTLDSIMGSCLNIANWRIPGAEEHTLIIFDTRGKMPEKEIEYLRGQLEGEFENTYFQFRRIKEGERDSVGRLNIPD